MSEVQKNFRNEDLAMHELAGALLRSKMESSYLSNESIAIMIVASLDQSDALDVARLLEKQIKGKYGVPPSKKNA